MANSLWSLILGDVVEKWPSGVVKAATCQMDLDLYGWMKTAKYKCKHKCFDSLGKFMKSEAGKKQLKRALKRYKKAKV